MPFSLNEMAHISSVLKELSVGLIELAYPDSSSELKMSLRHDIKPQFSQDQMIMSMWPRLFKVSNKYFISTRFHVNSIC